MVSALPYSGLISFGGHFRIFHNVEHHYENLRYRNTFNVTILSCTNSKFIQKCAPTITCCTVFFRNVIIIKYVHVSTITQIYSNLLSSLDGYMHNYCVKYRSTLDCVHVQVVQIVDSTS